MRHIDQNVRHIDQNVNHFSCDNCTFTGDDGIELPIIDWTTQTLGVRAIARDDPENLHRHHCTSHADRFLNSLFTPDNSSFFVFHASIYMIAFSEPHKSLFPPDESPGAAAKWFPFYSLQIFLSKIGNAVDLMSVKQIWQTTIWNHTSHKLWVKFVQHQ